MRRAFANRNAGASLRRWCHSKPLGPREVAGREVDVLRALESVRDDVYIGGQVDVKNVAVDPATSNVSFKVQLPNMAIPIKTQLQDACVESVRGLDWLPEGGKVKVSFTAAAPTPPPSANLEEMGPGMQQVANVIAVYSCKGGVGKSTVAVNLAYSLKALGGRVGLFDADIYGPSLPLMVSPEDTEVKRTADGQVNALEYEGVKCMSYGWVAPVNHRGERGGANMRGPMVSSVVQQLVKNTNWGPLDFLVVDMPPGTGDIQLTLGQQVTFSSAVMVTTPQKLSFIDVGK
jgi:Mrp family chromosome partitioning ATPase